MYFEGSVKKYLVSLLIVSSLVSATETKIMNPNDIEIGPILHQRLTDDLLNRIKSITDILEVVDGVSYEQSVDLYKRDLDPEANLVIYEEMARVYKEFCDSRCMSQSERMDVYRLVLIRSMFEEDDVLKNIDLNVLNQQEALSIIKSYKLKAESIVVYGD